MNTPITPCDDRIVVEPHEPKVGSIIIPEANIHDHIGHREGTVIAIGTGKVYEKVGRRIPLHDGDFEVGDRIMYHKWAGSEMTIQGKKVVVMQAKDVLAVCVAGSINAALDAAP